MSIKVKFLCELTFVNIYFCVAFLEMIVKNGFNMHDNAKNNKHIGGLSTGFPNGTLTLNPAEGQ